MEKLDQTIYLRGVVDQKSDSLLLEQGARKIFPLVHVEIESFLDHSPTVFFRVYLLELKRSHFKNFGFSWPSVLENAITLQATSLRGLSSLDVTLNQLELEGHVKILSKPELVVRAPGEAELFSGGELPLQNQTRFYSNVMWKKHGLTLHLKVNHVIGNRVRLDILTEVSHLDTSTQATDKVPGIHSNRMQTQVDAHFGVPLFLSGLLQQKEYSENKGVPFLGGLPLIGPLFGTQSKTNERSELVAILYPQANPPLAPMPKMAPLGLNLFPKGRVPIPRNWISPQEEHNLRQSQDYPWNAFQ